MLRRPRLVLTVCPRVKLGALTTVFFENLTNVSLAFNVVVIFPWLIVNPYKLNAYSELRTVLRPSGGRTVAFTSL